MDDADNAYLTGREMRERLAARLDGEGRMDLADRLRKCGLPMVLRSTCCDDAVRVETRCKNKWCPTCARGIAGERAARLDQVVRTFRWPLFATFTMKNVPDLHSNAVRELRRAFGRFRRMKAFGLVEGGIASIEVTNIGNGWHPHLHCVMDCRWLGPQRTRPLSWETPDEKREASKLAKLALEAAWAKALRQPMAVCHAKRTTADEVIREVVKYSVKGQDLLKCRENVGPLIDCLAKCRLVTTFGTAHGFKFKENERELRACECGGCLDSPKPRGGRWGWLPQEVWAMDKGRDQHHLAWVNARDLAPA